MLLGELPQFTLDFNKVSAAASNSSTDLGHQYQPNQCYHIFIIWNWSLLHKSKKGYGSFSLVTFAEICKSMMLPSGRVLGIFAAVDLFSGPCSKIIGSCIYK